MSSLCSCYGVSNPSTTDLHGCLYLSSHNRVTLGNVTGRFYCEVWMSGSGLGGPTEVGPCWRS